VKPVTVSVDVPQSREEVFDYLDVLGNHEGFTDHFLVDWETSGPAQGAGARARMRVKKPGPKDWLEMEVITSERPRLNVEQSTSARGRRVTRGTYVLEERDGGGTSISFELAWLQAPAAERMIGPITRAVTRSANQKALRRLSEKLAERSGRPS
jgi:uncharacterized protein YndB with AHSA1/START domain